MKIDATPILKIIFKCGLTKHTAVFSSLLSKADI